MKLQNTEIDYVERIHNIMLVAHTAFFAGNSSFKHEVGTINAKGDRSLEMDVAIERAVINYIREQGLPVQIYSEEVGVTEGAHPHPEVTFSMDPLDGSVNYKHGQGMLPFGTLVAFFKGLNPNLDDVIAAGMIEYTTGNFFIFDGEKTINQDGEKVILNHDWAIHKTTPVYFDTFYKKGLKAYTEIAEEVFVRGSGSIVGNLMYTLLNISACTGGVSVRAEEIGAVYGLIKGASGIIVDHDGVPLAGKLFDSQEQYQVLAGNKCIVDFVVGRLSKI
jgi:fructose-1,6-bisphosphatase/inositol monophosphatase family enzyme